MNQIELLQYGLTFTLEVILCLCVFARRTPRLLPYFSMYACILLIGTIGLGITYERFGFRSAESYYAYWTSALVNVVARGFAIVELCRYGLRTYRGIWNLIWRFLSVLALIFIANAGFDAWGQSNRLAIYGLTLERDLDIAAIAILTVLLIVRSYYGLALDPLQWSISLGICLFCVIDVLNNSILRNLYAGNLFPWFTTDYISLWPALKPQIERVSDLYGSIRLISLMISTSIWCYALRKPLTAPERTPDLLPAEVYQEFSPALNMRLRAFNARLLEMLKS
jgi:hypothetical protein